jgi:hypothetical protein
MPATLCAWAFLFLGRRWHCLQGLKLCFNRRDIGINQVIEQASLIRNHLFAALANFKRSSCAIS